MSDTIRTDLALEAREALLGAEPGEIDGVAFDTRHEGEYDTTISTVRVLNQRGEKTVGKPVGTYVTLENQYLRQNILTAHEEIMDILTQALHKLLPLGPDDTVLVVGLGNRDVAADALGTLAVSGLLVTRHLHNAVPLELRNHLRPVSALAPGVMGQTGIETLEIVCGIQDRVRADAVILIDALAARDTRRVNTTIQLTDTGVSPGAGIGNRRQTLSRENLGVPVAALGIPTVVDTATIIRDAVPDISEGSLKSFSDLYVTPKNMDALAVRLSSILSGAINRFLHRLSHEELKQYLY